MKVLSILIGLSFIAVSADALPQRVFVSAIRGDDANNCSVNAPCRTFAKALTAVAVAGEVLVLDSGGYGPMTINNAVSVVAPLGLEASITQPISSQDAIEIDAAGATVILRGLSVFGLGVATTGLHATAVHALVIDSCNFSGFVFHGIDMNLLSGTATMSVENTSCFQNGGYGITTAGPSANAATFLVRHSHLENNGHDGIAAFQGSQGTVSESSLSHNVFTGISVQTQATGQTSQVEIDRCVISGNSGGIYGSANGVAGVEIARVTDSVIVNNGSGIALGDATAQILTRRDNTLQDNSFNGTFTGTFTTD